MVCKISELRNNVLIKSGSEKGRITMIACNHTCAECENKESPRRSAKVTQNLTNRLSRIEGQVKGIKSMIDREVYCDDVLTQIAAAQSALSSVAKILLESHMRACVTQRLKDGDDTVVEEFIKTIGRLTV